MKSTKLFMFGMLLLAVFAFSCSSDDDNINDDGDGDDVENYDIIVGNWRSPVVAPILESFTDSIHAEFKNNQTYLVKTYYDGAVSELSGVYETMDGVGNIRMIKLEQSAPTTLTSEGIYKIEDGKMTYEVAQTEPAQEGVTAPSPEGGFGSTSGGAFGEMNIQVYYKMD
ncbi:MAG TPA: hypothetical protein VK021_05645 [Flavobacteriaceae bacterium]|nr:hypothetical protein [Flavobacteriaceae bacterium]